jgi:hypothetical protein
VRINEVIMRRNFGVPLLLAVLALIWAVAGCRGGSEQTATTPSPGGAAPRPPAGGSATEALGTEQAAGPFQVTLSTEPTPPKVGATKFQVKVSRNGQPVSGATVKLSSSMPSMKMPGPDVTLKPAGDHYEGTGKLAMAGDWEATVTVSAAGDTGAATYRFTSGQ